MSAHAGLDTSSQELLQHFLRHLVVFSWYEARCDAAGNPVEEPAFCMASGFIFEAGGRWWLVSAGHVFLDYRQRCDELGITAIKPRVVDLWDDSADRIPPIVWDFFDQDVHGVFCDDENDGLDYAVIEMPPLIAKALSVSIVPFRKVDWDNPPVDMDFYAVVGAPADHKEQQKWKEGGQNVVASAPRAVVAYADLVDGEVYGVDPKKVNRFVAKLGPVPTTFDVQGMSGGPILGFKKFVNGELRYYPVAIQSRWLRSKRVIIGTPLEVLGRIIDEVFRRIDAGEI